MMKRTAKQRIEAIQTLRAIIRNNSEKITDGQFAASREFGRLYGNANAKRQIALIQQAAQKEWGAGWENRADEIDEKEAAAYAVAKKEADELWDKIINGQL